MLSCYDYPTTLWAEEAGVDIILVGDSVGVKMLGYDNPGQVTMDDMLHHLKAVQRAVKDAYLIADLPISSCMNHERMLEDSRVSSTMALMPSKLKLLIFEW
jgi:3-methyl-2-oxobutanoate hydroxymethyltransferase